MQFLDNGMNRTHITLKLSERLSLLRGQLFDRRLVFYSLSQTLKTKTKSYNSGTISVLPLKKENEMK